MKQQIVKQQQVIRRDSSASGINTRKVEKAIIGIACLSFFPLTYLIGRIIIQWLSS